MVRIWSWDEWQGPERGYGDWFGRWPAYVRERIDADHLKQRKELTVLDDRVRDLVLKKAIPNVPDFDQSKDPWYGPTACVFHAAYIAGLVVLHIHLARPLQNMIAEEWRWFADGHWPCDFAVEPVGLDESLDNVPEVKLLVY